MMAVVGIGFFLCFRSGASQSVADCPDDGSHPWLAWRADTADDEQKVGTGVGS